MDLHPQVRLAVRLRRGFSLLEMLLVVIIIGILAAVVIPSLAGRSEEARIVAAKQEIIGALGLALDIYEQDTGSYPTTKQGLEALVSAPGGVQNWRGVYLKAGSVPKDPWGNPYEYIFPSTRFPGLYELSSNGPDGAPDTDDDISNLATE